MPTAGVASAAFKPCGQGLRLERSVQYIGAANRNHTVGAGVLPRIAKQTCDISRIHCVFDVDCRVKNVGLAQKPFHLESAGVAERSARLRVRREMILGTEDRALPGAPASNSGAVIELQKAVEWFNPEARPAAP